jgi:hypothetical protein
MTSTVFARGGHGHDGGVNESDGRLCTGWSVFYLDLTTADTTLQLDDSQKAILKDFKAVVFENSENMQRACAEVAPLAFDARVTASEARLSAMLDGVRKVKPLAEKFYASLTDTQRAKFNAFPRWPGL